MSDTETKELVDRIDDLLGSCPPKKTPAREFLEAQYDAGLAWVHFPVGIGGLGLSPRHQKVINEKVYSAGGPSSYARNPIGYGMCGPTVVEWGTDEQKSRYLRPLFSGEEVWCQLFSEPGSGSDFAGLSARAVRDGDEWVVNGQKVWISRIQHSDLMILLARTTPLAAVTKKSDGMSIFMVDIQSALREGMTVRPILNMVNHETNEVFFDNLEIPAENLIGQEGQGFKYILDGLNAERVLIAAECIGDAYWLIDKARRYANERVVFDRPIGKNQGIQFPIADAYIETEAANLMRFEACRLFDDGKPCGPQANMAKYLAAKASFEAANTCLQTHGGFGFACEYDVERKFRETRLYQVAPISTNLIYSYIAEHVLGLPRSF